MVRVHCIPPLQSLRCEQDPVRSYLPVQCLWGYCLCNNPIRTSKALTQEVCCGLRNGVIVHPAVSGSASEPGPEPEPGAEAEAEPEPEPESSSAALLRQRRRLAFALLRRRHPLDAAAKGEGEGEGRG